MTHITLQDPPKMSKKSQEELSSDNTLIESTADALEKKVSCFWNKNRSLILKCAVAIFLGFALVESWDLIEQRKIAGLQAEYQQAQTLEEKIEFANAHSSQPLAGLAFLSAADDSYEKKDYSKSIEYYQKSIPPLKGTPLVSRATLGLALSKVQTGQNEEGQALLKDIINSPDTLNVFKAEASYQLATIAIANNDFTTARSYLKSINNFPFSGLWAQKAEVLMEGNPLLTQDS